jgi:ribosomal protein S18 acetylase RimI-like enzyme
MTNPESQTVVLREATAADAAALAELHVATFNETHGPGPGVTLRRSQWEAALKDTDPASFCIVLQNAEVGLLGFARGIRHNDAGGSGYAGELNKIYLLRRFHRRGLGRKLIGAAAEHFVARGLSSMLLFGDARSPTNGFYEAMGGERIYAASGEFHGAYGWRDLRQLMAKCHASREPS